MSAVQPARSDRVLLLLAGGGILLSIATAVVGSLGLLPAPLVVVVVLAATSLGVRVALLLRRRRSSALANPRVMNIVSLCGLGFSAVAALATLGVVLPNGGPAMFLADLGLHAWSLALLILATAPVRTVGWQSLAGVTLAGFLGSSALAHAVGTPVVTALGVDNVVATSIWVPVTEELLKALPVAVIVLLAVRDRVARPSLADIAVLGAFSGAGFTLIENAEFGRLFSGWTVAPPISLLFPTLETGSGSGPIDVIAGHTVWTAFLSLAIGFGILYRRRLRFAWIAIPTAFLLVVVEHGMGNALVGIVFGGLASPVLLILGLATAIWFEHRPLRHRSGFRDGILIRPETARLRRAAFAGLQVATPNARTGHQLTTDPDTETETETDPEEQNR